MESEAKWQVKKIVGDGEARVVMEFREEFPAFIAMIGLGHEMRCQGRNDVRYYIGFGDNNFYEEDFDTGTLYGAKKLAEVFDGRGFPYTTGGKTKEMSR